MAIREENILRGTLLFNEPMARYTSWRAGGAARQFYIPADRDDLVIFLQTLPLNEEIVFLGLGSNLLVRDGGIKGTVIAMQGVLGNLKLLENKIIYAEAGVACAKLAKFCVNHHLSGGEWFAGIPGTVGGALAMNAGAFGGDTWQHVLSVETIAVNGVIYKRSAQEFTVGYRSVQKPADEWFLAAWFRFDESTDNQGKQNIKALLAKRAKTQPTGVHSCGSVFRNPAGDYAARLIESLGLKGYRIGGAHVSEKHANFIINDKAATAQDIESLVYYVRDQVTLHRGVQLEPEVQIVGEKA